MSLELMLALRAWGAAVRDCVALGECNSPTPVPERKKPDDTEGGDCD